LADESFEALRPELRQSLTEYYRVNNMHNYDELLRALGYFTHKYGRIDRIDSHNEYWLETEAQLRTDFNITGIKNNQIGRIKQKSKMKETYRKAGVEVARGKVVHTLPQARIFIEETGFPVVAKPDVGVGAAKTYKIHSDPELVDFFNTKPNVDYIMEEFVDGVICSFDGLTNKEGYPVFYTGHQYSKGIMETVNNDELIYYYSYREIPPDLEEAGHKVLKAFDVRERFFHFEFFRRKSDNKIVALEVNMRPPGGLTTDMFNFANDIDVYAEWANIIVNDRFSSVYSRHYHCAYISRKYNRSYKYNHEQLLQMLGSSIVHNESISGVFSAALGDHGYLVRTPDINEIHHFASLIQE